MPPPAPQAKRSAGSASAGGSAGLARPDPADLFEQVPRAFFGPLTGALAPLYWSVLARFYHYEFEREPFFLLRETALEVIGAMLTESPLWNERRDDLLGGEPADEEAEREAARRMLDRLEKSGWIHFEYRSSAGGAVLNFHAHAARMMEVMMRTARGEQPILQGYAHSIATLLKPDSFAGSPGVALVEAKRHTLDLVRELKILNRNIQAFTQKLLDEASSAASILEHGLDRYQSAVMANYHRLKTVDNLFKWRTRILDRLERIARDEASLDSAAAWTAEQYGVDREEARRRIDGALTLMRSQFETLPDITDDLDRRNARFSGVALRKLMYLLRQDRRTEAQLQFLVDTLSASPEALQSEEDFDVDFDVYKCSLLADGFLYTNRKKRAPIERQKLEHKESRDLEEVRKEAATRVRRLFGRKRMEERIAALMANRDSMETRELPLEDDDDYVSSMYTAAYGLDGRSTFTFEESPGERVESGPYQIPPGAHPQAEKAPLMDFAHDFPMLEPAAQEHFRHVVTRLLSGHVLTPGEALRPDPDWRFAEKNEGLIDAYLRIGGWRLELDPALRLCRAIHISGRQRVQFSKLESLILCMCRLVYHEEMSRAAEEEACELTVSQLRERLVQAGKPLAQLSRTAMIRALRRLARHELVAIDRGFTGADDERIGISSVIEKILPPDRIAELYQKVREYVGGEEDEDAPEAVEAEDS